MKGLDKKKVVGIILLVLAAIVIALGDTGHSYGWNFASRVVTAGIILYILWVAAGKKIAGFFVGRRDSIEQELVDLESRKTEARESLANVEERIANMEAERQEIIAEYRKQGEIMQAAIIEKAEKAAVQIAEQAQKSAENDAKQAVEDMRSEMAELIVSATEEALAKKLDANAHQQLIDKYLTKVVLN